MNGIKNGLKVFEASNSIWKRVKIRERVFKSTSCCRRSPHLQVASVAATDLIYGNNNAMWQHAVTFQLGYVYELASPAGAFVDASGNSIVDAKSSLFRVALELSDYRGTDNADTGTKVTEDCVRGPLVSA